jgi:hypothetical protein
MNSNAPSRPAIGGTPLETARLRRRNLRFMLLLVAGLVVATLLCAAYIYWFGGANKPAMKPYHSVHTATETIDAA